MIDAAFADTCPAGTGLPSAIDRQEGHLQREDRKARSGYCRRFLSAATNAPDRADAPVSIAFRTRPRAASVRT